VIQREGEDEEPPFSYSVAAAPKATGSHFICKIPTEWSTTETGGLQRTDTESTDSAKLERTQKQTQRANDVDTHQHSKNYMMTD